MTKAASTTKKPCKQHTLEFRDEALKLANALGWLRLPASLTCMNRSSTTGEENSKISSLLLNANRRCPQRSSV